MNDRFDDIDDLLLQDVSPREEWAAITDERVMRRALSRQLKWAANHAYKLDQEAVTADENETDIRLRSTVSDQEGTIELKVGEKGRLGQGTASGAIGTACTKIYAADSCRAGCFVVTIATERHWEHPETREVLDLAALITLLNEEAHRVMEHLGGTLRVCRSRTRLEAPPIIRARRGGGQKK
ncbi:MAG: hypothetical protein WDN04_00270 [Rhodospirillales bacterium]